MKKLAQAWNAVPTSIFSTMTLAAQQAGAINLAQGFPDFDGPSSVKEAAILAIQEGYNQYAPSSGLLSLRQAICHFEERFYHLCYDPETETTIFSGATEALFCAILALCEPQDELITFEPFYDSYFAATLAAQAKLVPVSLHPPRWCFSPEELEARINSRTKAIILNSPHNPTGKVFTADELASIAKLALKHDLYVITDEVYEKIIFSPASHQPIASLAGMRERTITISSCSKTFSFTGWKVGYSFAPAFLSQALRRIHQYTVFCSATPLQMGAINAFQLPDDYYTRLQQSYAAKRELLLSILLKAGFKCFAPEGSYFITADYSQLSEAPDDEFALWLTHEKKVACIPLSAFYLNPQATRQHLKYVRFGFCKSQDTLNMAADYLRF